MKCPHCGYKEDKVVDSRATQEQFAIRRRRECLKCGKRKEKRTRKKKRKKRSRRRKRLSTRK